MKNWWQLALALGVLLSSVAANSTTAHAQRSTATLQGLPRTAAKATVATKTRGRTAQERDRARMATTKPTGELKELLTQRSALTGRMSDGAWHGMKSGKSTFEVQMGKTSVELMVGRYDLPGHLGRTTKLHGLRLNKAGANISKTLLSEDGGVILLGQDSLFRYDRGSIEWRGPESRFSMLTLLHEDGHSQDFTSASRVDRTAFEAVYNKVAAQQSLSGAEHRLLVGLERSAWAHALRSARALKKEGFDLLGPSTIAEIKAVIDGSLKGYYEYGR